MVADGTQVMGPKFREKNFLRVKKTRRTKLESRRLVFFIVAYLNPPQSPYRGPWCVIPAGRLWDSHPTPRASYPNNSQTRQRPVGSNQYSVLAGELSWNAAMIEAGYSFYLKVQKAEIGKFRHPVAKRPFEFV
jgi:hypothetical protein